MYANQLPAAEIRPIPPRRGRRRVTPYHATRTDGPYRPPRPICEWAESALQGRGNREACWRLLTWLMALHGQPKRLGAPFPIVRDVLCRIPTLGLTRDQVRRATEALVRVGALERMTPVGEGGFLKGRRIAVLYRFGPELQAELEAALERRKCKGKCPTARPSGSSIRTRAFRKPGPAEATPHTAPASSRSASDEAGAVPVPRLKQFPTLEENRFTLQERQEAARKLQELAVAPPVQASAAILNLMRKRW